MKTIHYSVPIRVQENVKEQDSQVFVQGTAINETVTRNGYKYTPEVLKDFAPTLIGKPILDTHNDKSIFNILGNVVEAEYTVENGKGKVTFKGEIKDPEAKKLVKDGRVQNVSIGATVEDLIKENESNIFTVKGLKATELSLCSVPGDPEAKLSIAQNLDIAIAEAFQKNKEEEKMVKEQEPEKKEEEPTEPEKKEEQEDTITTALEEIKTMLSEIKSMLEKKEEPEAQAEEPEVVPENFKSKNQVTEATVQEDDGFIVEKTASGVRFYKSY